jgi:lipoate-protein ligase A
VGALCRAGARAPGRRSLTDSGLTGVTSFAVTRARGPAAELVRVVDQSPRERLCVLQEVTDKAVVLGSTQRLSDVDETACRSKGIDVVRRKSGGGAVFVEPGSQLWVDFFLPAGDPLFESDVGRSFEWLGKAWAEAIGALSDGPAPLVASPGRRAPGLARQLCFAGIGAGEVIIGGRKAVGISQRRSREGAWLFSMALLIDTVDELVSCLAATSKAPREPARALRCSSVALGLERPPLEAQLLRALP